MRENTDVPVILRRAPPRIGPSPFKRKGRPLLFAGATSTTKKWLDVCDAVRLNLDERYGDAEYTQRYLEWLHQKVQSEAMHGDVNQVVDALYAEWTKRAEPEAMSPTAPQVFKPVPAPDASTHVYQPVEQTTLLKRQEAELRRNDTQDKPKAINVGPAEHQHEQVLTDTSEQDRAEKELGQAEKVVEKQAKQDEYRRYVPPLDEQPVYSPPEPAEEGGPEGRGDWA